MLGAGLVVTFSAAEGLKVGLATSIGAPVRGTTTGVAVGDGSDSGSGGGGRGNGGGSSGGGGSGSGGSGGDGGERGPAEPTAGVISAVVTMAAVAAGQGVTVGNEGQPLPVVVADTSASQAVTTIKSPRA